MKDFEAGRCRKIVIVDLVMMSVSSPSASLLPPSLLSWRFSSQDSPTHWLFGLRLRRRK